MRVTDELEIVTIGKLTTTTHATTRMPTQAWTTLYEVRARVTRLSARDEWIADTERGVQKQRVVVALVSTTGVDVELERGMELVEKTAFAYATDKSLPRYRLIAVQKRFLAGEPHHWRGVVELINP